MVERTVQILNKNGLHARPAAEIVGLGQIFVVFLEANEFHHATELEHQLVVVHDMKKNDFVMVIAQALEHRFQATDICE